MINEDKTKLMVINGTADDRRSFRKGGVTVDHADEYIYLGSPFSATGCITTDVKEHATLKQKHVNKFHILCGENQSMPFTYKKTVFDTTANRGSPRISRRTPMNDSIDI